MPDSPTLPTNQPRLGGTPATVSGIGQVLLAVGGLWAVIYCRNVSCDPPAAVVAAGLPNRSVTLRNVPGDLPAINTSDLHPAITVSISSTSPLVRPAIPLDAPDDCRQPPRSTGGRFPDEKNARGEAIERPEHSAAADPRLLRSSRDGFRSPSSAPGDALFGYADIPTHAGRAELNPALAPEEEGWLIVSAFAAPTTHNQVALTVSRQPQPISSPPDATWRSAAFATRDPLTNDLARRASIPPAVADECHGRDRQDDIPASDPRHDAVVETLFWPANGSGQAFSAVHCREVCRGERVRVVWDEAALAAESARTARFIVALVEQWLLPAVEAEVGLCADVDGNQRLTIAVSPRLHDVAPGAPDLKAFVRAADFQPQGKPPWSNRSDVVYLAPEVSADELPAILMHELTHVAQFSALRQEFGEGAWPLSDWLLEGHAHAVELLQTGRRANLAGRVAMFLRHPERCPLWIEDAAATGRWREPGSRGATAAFCLWLTERFGRGWWREVPALAATDDAWREHFGAEFRELYREWTVSLLVRGVAASLCQPGGCAESAPRVRPRCHPLVGDECHIISLVGTSTAYFRLHPAVAREGRLELHGPSTAELQVTFVRGPRSHALGDPSVEEPSFRPRPNCRVPTDPPE
jgi:hypothetical protein